MTRRRHSERRATRAAIRLVIAGLLVARAAAAAVSQPAPDNTTLPQPTSTAELDVVEGRGFSADADTLTGLFQNFGNGADQGIDPVNDADTAPGTFPGQCGFKVQIVLHGGGCQNALGWYNATDPASTPTSIYLVVPANLTAAPPNGISCADTDFCPLATRTTTQAPAHSWFSPLPEFDLDLKSNPNWTGGPVGFALVGAPTGVCTQTKYSQVELGDKSSSGAPWISGLIYHSHADPGGYYLAFEDSPTCPASWHGCSPGTNNPLPAGGNDGDFNDAVFYVAGLNCSLSGSADGGIDASTTGGMNDGGAAGERGTDGAAGTGGVAGGAGAGGMAGASSGTGDAGAAGAAGAGGVGAAGAAGAGAPAGTGGASAGSGGASGISGHPGGPTTSGNSGCSCRLAGQSPALSLWTSLLCVLALIRRRRAGRARDQ